MCSGNSNGSVETFWWGQKLDEPCFITKKNIQIHEGCVRAVTAIATGSGNFITGAHDGRIVITDIDHGTKLFEFNELHNAHVFSIEVITTGNYFATGGNDGILNVLKVCYNQSKRMSYP